MDYMNSKILIVDDENSIRLAFKIILSEAGYTVFTAEGYDQAIEVITQEPPDLIISDIILNGQSGIEFLNVVKKRQLICPVIMITGEPNIETSAEAVRLGAFDYIPKPIRQEALLRIVHNAVRHKRLLDKKLEVEKENLSVRQNLEAIFQSVEEGLVCVDSQMRVMEANSALKDICGLVAEKMIGNRFDASQIKCNNACYNVLQQTLQLNDTIKKIRTECHIPGKPSQVVVLTGTPLKFEGKPSNGAVLTIRNVTRLTNLELELKKRKQFHQIIGKSKLMENIFHQIENMSDIDTTVLITGETGTGKELFANAIHTNSLRKNKPLIKVNCSALNENLLESELFGHVKGAFTGAVKDKTGRFEMADQGTLFLDELGDMSPLTQLKLLRVLQEKEFEKVGDSRTIKVNVRIISATNRDLKEKVKLGEFREDLYYRINVVNIHIPALRDRREDIPMLADHFLTRLNEQSQKKVMALSEEAMTAFMNYSWPGNIRELEHAVEHGFVLTRTDTILFEHLPMEIKDFFKDRSPAAPPHKAHSKEDILSALHKARWNKSKAATLLGISRRTIYRRIEEFGISDS